MWREGRDVEVVGYPGAAAVDGALGASVFAEHAVQVRYRPIRAATDVAAVTGHALRAAVPPQPPSRIISQSWSATQTAPRQQAISF